MYMVYGIKVLQFQTSVTEQLIHVDPACSPRSEESNEPEESSNKSHGPFKSV